jgi:hypothetical protein
LKQDRSLPLIYDGLCFLSLSAAEFPRQIRSVEEPGSAERHQNIGGRLRGVYTTIQI